MSLHSVGQYPAYRPRRLRQSPALRRLVGETQLYVAQLVLPLFVRSGRKTRHPIGAMPGVFQLSPDELLREATQAHELGVPAVLLFGIPDGKDARASGAYAANGAAIGGRHAGAVYGLMNTGANLMGFVNAILLSTVAALMGWKVAIAMGAVFALLAVLFILLSNASRQMSQDD